MDEKVDKEDLCGLCGKGRVMATCLSCGLSICERCACYENAEFRVLFCLADVYMP
jgi:hypothetical protein